MTITGPSISRRTALAAAGAAVVGGYALSRATGAAAAPASSPHQLVTYPIPDGVAQNTSFTVQARTPGGRWQPVSCYLVNLNLVDTSTGHGLTQQSSMAYFDFSGPVEVRIGYTKGPIGKARVRPLSYGIEPAVHRHSSVTFTLTEPRNVVVEVNGDIFDCLHLFAGAIDPNPPDADDPDVLYYGPGLHTVPGNVLTVPSGKTVYLAGGAVLKAGVTFSRVSGCKLLGRGVLTAPSGGGCTVEYASDIAIGGVTMLDPNGYAVTAGQVDGLTISGLRSFSNKGNGDGIDLFCCTNAVIEGVFMRNSDDCVAIYNHRWNYYGDSGNIVLRDSALWADVAHPVNVGTHGNTDSPETLDGLTISNVDILDHREPQLLYQGCIALNPGDSNLIRNVRIEDVRVEDFRQGQLINMRVMYNDKYNTSPGRGIQSVYVRNLSYTGSQANPSILVGYDDARGISDVTFENLVVNGALIATGMPKPTWYLVSDFVPMYANEHVTNLTFIPPQA